MIGALLSEQDRDTYEILIRGTLRDAVRARVRDVTEQSEAAKAAFTAAEKNLRTVWTAAHTVGMSFESLPIRPEDQASVHVNRETLVALKELAVRRGHDPDEVAQELGVSVIPQGALGSIMSALQNGKTRNFRQEFASLPPGERENLTPAIRILLLGADRDVVRAELAIAQSSEGKERAHAVEARLRAGEDFTIIADAAQALGINPVEISPETPAETHVTREKVVALRELGKLKPDTTEKPAIPVPSQGGLGEIFKAMQEVDTQLTDFSRHAENAALRGHLEMLLLGARRDAIKAEVAAAKNGNEGVQQRARRDYNLIVDAASDLQINPAQIVPDTAGKAHVTRELIAASQDLPPQRREEVLQSVNTNGGLNKVFQQLAKGDAPEMGAGKAAARG
ncbi:MAG TPA: hypothetical protein VFT64_03290 [Rickettsiales bacterium]|nr:hypothetical protein [Rickettsiales bacterium]